MTIVVGIEHINHGLVPNHVTNLSWQVVEAERHHCLWIERHFGSGIAVDGKVVVSSSCAHGVVIVIHGVVAVGLEAGPSEMLLDLLQMISLSTRKKPRIFNYSQSMDSTESAMAPAVKQSRCRVFEVGVWKQRAALVSTGRRRDTQFLFGYPRVEYRKRGRMCHFCRLN